LLASATRLPFSSESITDKSALVPLDAATRISEVAGAAYAV